MAASHSWYLATLLLGHGKPFVASIAAVIALGAAADRRGRRAFEWIFGVALGLMVADGIVSIIGTGTVQIGVVVALAMMVAVLLGGGAALASQTSIA